MTDTKIDWLEKHSNAKEIILNVSHHLNSLARAFKITGNDQMHRNLANLADHLYIAQKKIDEVTIECINEQRTHANQHTKVILEAALSRIILNKGEIK